MNPITAHEGWFVLHCYYRINRKDWFEADPTERRGVPQAVESVLERFRETPNCQAFLYSIWGHKGDLGVMLVDPDLDHLNQTENEILSVFPAGSVEVTHSFVSMSEISEYVAQEHDYDRTLREKEGLAPDSPEYQEKMGAFRTRMRVYVEERLHPQIPAHRVNCFYPMNKARRDQANWYQLGFEERKNLMSSHMITGRKFAGKVQQLVTGSFGLDGWEWGVTLFADDPFYFKQILYQMRYDEVSAVYGEFGDFIIGIQMQPKELFERLRLA